MALLLTFRGAVGISHFAFFLWGLAFGPLVTMYQTAVSKQVAEAKRKLIDVVIAGIGLA